MDCKINQYIEPNYYSDSKPKYHNEKSESKRYGYDIYLSSYHGENGVLHNNLKYLRITPVDKETKTPLKILDDVPYYVTAGGNIIYEGVYKNSDNIFPAYYVPFKNVRYHEITIYFKTGLPSNNSNILFHIEAELYECDVEEKTKLVINWPTHTGLIICSGMMGISG